MGVYKPKYRDRKTGEYREGQTWWIVYFSEGRRIRENSKSTRKTDAQKLLTQRKAEVAQGRLPGYYFDKTTFEELAELYLADMKNKKSSRRARQHVANLKRHFKGVRACKIDTMRLKAYIEARQSERHEQGDKNGERKVKDSTINRELAALKRMLNLGRNCTPPKVDRLPHFPMLRESSPRTGFFEHHEFLALRNALPEYLRGLVTFAYRTGWRREEIASLTWDHVDLIQRTVTLSPGKSKNDEGRTLALDHELYDLLRDLFLGECGRGKGDPRAFVFQNERGTDRIKQFGKTWRTACRKAGVGDRLFHDFRRTAIRNMVRAGIPERVAMQVSGHKTRSIFDRYNIVSEADLREAAERQAEYLDAMPTTAIATALPNILPFKKELRRAQQSP